MSVWQRGWKFATPQPTFDTLPLAIIARITNKLSIGERNNVARVSRSLDQDMGGKEGWEAQKVENTAAMATRMRIAAIDKKRAARELRAKRCRKDKLRLAAGVIDID